MAKTTSDVVTSENQKIRSAQKRSNRILRRLKKTAKAQKLILDGRVSRFIPLVAFQNKVKEAVIPYTSVHGGKQKGLFSKDSYNVLASIVVDKTMRDLLKVRAFCVQNGRTQPTKRDAEFVLDQIVKPKRVEFEPLA